MVAHDFNRGWAFAYSSGNAYLDAKGAAYKKTVDLPHDFMISTKRTPDAPTEGAGGFFQGGVGTYEKHFELDASQKGHQFLLLVEGSYGNTEIWINGSMAALHHYGYTEFYADLTKWLKFGEDNKLKIVVENNAHPNSRWYSGSGLYRHVRLLEGEQIYLAPWSVSVQTPDLQTIQAEVTLTVAGSASQNGEACVCENAASEKGEACAANQKLATVAGTTAADAKREVIFSILDADGIVVAEQTKQVVCHTSAEGAQTKQVVDEAEQLVCDALNETEQTKQAACSAPDFCLMPKMQEETTCTFEFSLENLIPWSLDNPYLYTARVQVRKPGEAADIQETDSKGTDIQAANAQKTETQETNSQETDTQEAAFQEEKEITFGVRTISFTRERGFCLNGELVKLKGGCIHHDNGVVGSCAFDAMEYRRVRLLKENGYNAIRTSHNPQSPALMDACDRLGMLVMDEAFDCWRAKKNAADYHLYFEKCWKEDLASMILRDRNHPSVIMYSIGNEIGERDGSGNGPEISAAMCAFVRSLDDTRAITNGVCAVFLDAGEFGGILANIFGSGEAIDFASLPEEVRGFLAQADEVTKNWGAITADFVKDLDVVGYNYLDDRYEQDGNDFPERLIVGTESYPKAMKQVWERTMAHPYVIGDFTWTAMDYLGESGIGHAFYDQDGGLFCDYPWHTGNCGDFDICGFVRPQGKFRRLLWKKDSAPVITVLHPEHTGKKEAISSWGWADVYESYTWTGYEGKEIRADIYSDAEEIEIKVNGKFIGRKVVPENGIVSVPLTYEPGVLEVTNIRGGAAAESSSLETAGKAVSIRLTPEEIPESFSCTEDILIIRAEAVDQDGRRVPDWQRETRCIVDGAAQLEGFGSGSPTSEDPYTSGCCHFFEGRALLVLRKTQAAAPQEAFLTLAAGQKETQETVSQAAELKEAEAAASLTIRVEETGEGGIFGEMSLGGGMIK
ncbi:MAG: DUF4982 domain-containing protein [Lachnospiraceae bacterium]|nr:DUF4982 domain-containing protein [Lachnospiraceae bacterium]